MSRPRRRELAKLLTLGSLSALLYVMLFANEERVLGWLSQGGWYALIPVGAAFAFSLVHGAFAGQFWSVLGVTERRPQQADGQDQR